MQDHKSIFTKFVGSKRVDQIHIANVEPVAPFTISPAASKYL